MLPLRTQRLLVQDRCGQAGILRVPCRPLIGDQRPDAMNSRMPVDTAPEGRVRCVPSPAGVSHLARQFGYDAILVVLEASELRRCRRGALPSSADRGRDTPD